MVTAIDPDDLPRAYAWLKLEPLSDFHECVEVAVQVCLNQLAKYAKSKPYPVDTRAFAIQFEMEEIDDSAYF